MSRGLPVQIQRNLEAKKFIGVFQGIAPATAAKQTSTLQITAAYNFVDMYLILGNLTAAMLQEIRLKIGGDVIQRWAGTQLNTRLLYDNVPSSATYNVLKLPLRRMGLRGGFSLIDFAKSIFVDGGARMLSTETSLNCGSAGAGFSAIENVSIEVDVINTGVAQPTLSLYARVTSPIEGGPGAVYRVDKQTKTISNGSVVITKPEMGLDALRPFLNRLSLFAPAGATFSDFMLRYGTNDWLQLSPDLLSFTGAEDNLHTPQAGLTVLDFQEVWGDTVLDLSAPSADILLQFTCSGLAAADALTYYVETLGAPFAPRG